MDSKNTIFYSTADEGYARTAGRALLRVRRFVPRARLCVISRKLGRKNKLWLKAWGIRYLERDYSDLFAQTWDYPIEAYYIFAGPELFAADYRYSVYIDGDVVCGKNPFLPEVKGMAGAAVETPCTRIFGGEYPAISRLFRSFATREQRPRMNSGVVYFNNRLMAAKHLLTWSAMLYKKCLSAGVPRKGDDSLLALLQLVDYADEELEFLPEEYNYMPVFHAGKLPEEPVTWLHFAGPKLEGWEKRL